jgi:uncharacterized phage infection (PIP) family protein YhgE
MLTPLSIGWSGIAAQAAADKTSLKAQTDDLSAENSSLKAKADGLADEVTQLKTDLEKRLKSLSISGEWRLSRRRKTCNNVCRPPSIPCTVSLILRLV